MGAAYFKQKTVTENCCCLQNKQTIRQRYNPAGWSVCLNVCSNVSINIYLYNSIFFSCFLFRPGSLPPPRTGHLQLPISSMSFPNVR